MGEIPRQYQSPWVRYSIVVLVMAIPVVGLAATMASEFGSGGTFATFFAKYYVVFIFCILLFGVFMFFAIFVGVTLRRPRKGAAVLGAEEEFVFLTSGVSGLKGDLILLGIEASIPTNTLATIGSDGLKLWTSAEDPEEIVRLDWRTVRKTSVVRFPPPPFGVRGFEVVVDTGSAVGRIRLPVYGLSRLPTTATTEWLDAVSRRMGELSSEAQ